MFNALGPFESYLFIRPCRKFEFLNVFGNFLPNVRGAVGTAIRVVGVTMGSAGFENRIGYRAKKLPNLKKPGAPTARFSWLRNNFD